MQQGGPPVPSRVPPPRLGRRRFGRYELIGELARGGMGTVYLARHAGEAGFQRLFAIKVMHPHLAEEKSFVDMLYDEARISARIHHPNVVPIIDLGSQGDLHYVVMDYIEGTPFGRMIKRSGEPSFAEIAVTVLIDSLEGLHVAHTLVDDDGRNLQLVHRDVSPQNILVGVDGIARITDFGIAKAETRITSTQPGMRKGKLAFMSPEQIANDEAVDLRADVWAAGVVLWTALTGKTLFRAENDAATIHNVLSKPIEPPSRAGSHPPPFFDEVVMRALERDQTQRFSSALEMAEALRTAATAHGLSCSKHKVAKWVSETFGEELLQRRDAIRAAARRYDENDGTETSRITALSAIPGIGVTHHGKSASGSMSHSGFAAGSYTQTPAGEGSSMSRHSVPHAARQEMLSSGDIAVIEDVRRPTRKGLWVAVGALSALLAGAAVFLIRGGPQPEIAPSSNVATVTQRPVGTAATPATAAQDIATPPSTKPAVATPVSTTAPIASAAAPETQPLAPTEAEAPAETEGAAAEAEPADGDKVEAAKPERARPRYVRSHARKPAPRAEPQRAPAPAPEPAKEPSPEPAAREPAPRAPAPAPAAPGQVIENNPYMRR